MVIHTHTIILSCYCWLIINDSDLHSNTASLGGGLCATGEARIMMFSCHLLNNTADAGGPHICADGSARVLTDHVLGLGNSATEVQFILWNPPRWLSITRSLDVTQCTLVVLAWWVEGVSCGLPLTRLLPSQTPPSQAMSARPGCWAAHSTSLIVPA